MSRPMVDLALAVVLVLVQGAFTYLSLGAGVGFDDANITMNYAQNIADGHGYVYYVGGERVEGSTSPLWTALNVLGYLLPVPIEAFLAGLGGLIGLAIAWLVFSDTRRVAQALGANPDHAVAAAFVVLISAAHFWAWMIWSYMDIGLWCLLLVAAVWLMPRLGAGRLARWGFGAVLCLLVWQRPEGVAFALALLGLAAFIWRAALPFLVIAGLTLVAAFSALMALRLWYFGFPFPNTFYAKVSTSLGEQLGYGLTYTFGFLSVPLNAAALLALAVGVGLARGQGAVMKDGIARLTLILAGLVIHSLLGGDHFGSYRFYLFVLPLAVPFMGLVIALVVPRFQPATRGGRAALGVLALALIVGGAQGYLRNKGELSQELYIAAFGQEMGRKLNREDGIDSIGVLTAGGISLTFEGEIRDLLGLNWVEMAHTGRDGGAGLKNHGGFDERVFWRTPPDAIVFGGPLPCDAPEADLANAGKFLDGLFQDDRFRQTYRVACVDGLAYVRRS